MSKTLRPVINEQAQRYMERAMELGNYQSATEFVNAAIMIAYKHIVDQQHSAAGEWESQNWDRIKGQTEEMARLQLDEPAEQGPAMKGTAIG